MVVYRLAWALLFLTALVMTAVTLSKLEWDGPERLPLLRVGINYTRDATPDLLVYEVPGANARAAGVRPGDHIIALMGKKGLDDALGDVIDAPRGTIVPITVRHADNSVATVTLRAAESDVAAALETVGLSATLMRGWTRFILGFGAAIVLVASALLYRQRHNPVAALLAIAALIATATPTSIVGYDRALIGAAIGVALTNIAILAFPDGRFATPVARLLVVLNAIWLGMFFVAPDIHAQGIYPSIALSELAVVLRYRRSGLADRQQIRWAALGFAGAAVFSAAAAVATAVSYRFNSLFDTIANDMTTDALDLGNSLCLWGGLGVALLRFRLYDADVAITRSTVWAIAAPLLAIVFGMLTEVLKVLLAPIFPNDTVALAIAGVLTASLIQPIGDRLKQTVERWSRARLMALADDLPVAVQDMAENDDCPRMLAHVCKVTAPAVQAAVVAIALRPEHASGAWSMFACYGLDPDDARFWLDANAPGVGLAVTTNRMEPLFPLAIPLIARPDGEREAIGWMLVGRRPDGSIPDRGAIAALEGVSPAIGHAILAIAANARRSSMRINGPQSATTRAKPSRRPARES